jgi:mannose-6-phosphate isomerase-like protein (cupin superfamily)
MPPHTVNNLHIHYTAEVFMIYSGTWAFRWGADGKDGEIIGHPGDVVSVPTWIFRGFTNIGTDDGWIFTALGGDDTGGIIWHPSILSTAAEHGMYLTRDNMLVDTETGAPRPADDELLEPIDRSTIESLRRFSVDDMRKRVVTAGERTWSSRAMLDSCLAGHASEIAPVIGHGMTQDLEHAAPIANPHGFSVEWLRIPPGQAVGPFMLAEKQVLMVFKGAIAVTLDGGAAVETNGQEVFSVPGDTWRTIASVGGTAAEIAVLIAGDQKKHPMWAPEIVKQAAAAGVGVDHSGYVAPLRLLPLEVQRAVA